METSTLRKNRPRSQSTPSGKRTEITDNDIFGIFAPSRRHTQLTTKQLVAFDRRYESKTRNRLRAQPEETQASGSKNGSGDAERRNDDLSRETTPVSQPPRFYCPLECVPWRRMIVNDERFSEQSSAQS